MARIRVVLLALFCSGCMMHVNTKPPAAEIVIPTSCIEKLEPTPETLCHGPDPKHIRCDNISLTRQLGCEKLVVIKSKGKTK